MQNKTWMTTSLPRQEEPSKSLPILCSATGMFAFAAAVFGKGNMSMIKFVLTKPCMNVWKLCAA